MKRLFLYLVILLFVFQMSGCSTSKAAGSIPDNMVESQQKLIQIDNSTSVPLVSGEYRTIVSMDTDLNSDGIAEKVEVIEVKGEEEGRVNLQGLLRLTDKNGAKDIIYKENGNLLTGVFQDIKIEDLDGDGIKDIFIVIPDAGTGWPLNYFFIYNYKTSKAFSFDFDYNMNNTGTLLNSFKYKYKSDDELEIRNDKIGFNEVLRLSKYVIIPHVEQYRYVAADYNPVAIMNEEYIKNKQGEKFVSSIELLYDSKSDAEIRVPYLLEAEHHDNIIGEIDLYFIIDTDFQPVMKRFEIYNVDLEGNYKKAFVKEFILK